MTPMNVRIRTILVTAALAILAAGSLRAQDRFAVKTNLLHDAAGSVNLGVEAGIAPKWTVQLAGSFNDWKTGDRWLNHMLVSPEARYWFCERFAGTFVSVHGHAGTATLGRFWDFSRYYSKFPNLDTFMLKDATVLGLGVGIGHAFVLGRHWNLEMELGLGYMYAKGDEYELSVKADGAHYLPDNAIPVLEGSVFDYLGPTKVAVSIVYLF